MRTVLIATLLATLPACRGSSAQDPPGMPHEARAHARRREFADITLNTVEVGDERGPLRVVIHGGPGLDHTYLRPWLDFLGERSRLVYVDLRGHGRSSQPVEANAYTMAAAASDIAALINELSIDRPADIIAHDFGAEVALELAALHPERVGRLLLVDPFWRPQQIRTMGAHSRSVLGEVGWQRVQALSTPQGTLRNASDVTELFRRLGPMWWHRQPADAVLARMGRDMRYSAVADERFIAEATGWDGARRVDDVRAQVLVVSGSDDRTVLPEDSRSLAERLAHGRFVSIPDAGHCPFIEQPERFVSVAAGFLRRGGASE